MYLADVLDDLKQGKWIRRDVWHKRYAVKLCNLDMNIPFFDNKNIYFFSTLNGFYWIGNNSPPLDGEDFYQHSHRSRDGLQNDLFCDDWNVCEIQEMYDGILRKTVEDEDQKRREEYNNSHESKSEENRKRQHREQLDKSRDLWGRRLNVKRPFDIDDPHCDDCDLDSCDDCPIVLDPYENFCWLVNVSMFRTIGDE